MPQVQARQQTDAAPINIPATGSRAMGAALATARCNHAHSLIAWICRKPLPCPVAPLSSGTCQRTSRTKPVLGIPSRSLEKQAAPAPGPRLSRQLASMSTVVSFMGSFSGCVKWQCGRVKNRLDSILLQPGEYSPTLPSFVQGGGTEPTPRAIK